MLSLSSAVRYRIQRGARQFRGALLTAGLLAVALVSPCQAASDASPASETARILAQARRDFPGAARAPRPNSDAAPHDPFEKNAPLDEASGGVTAGGVTLYPRTEACFPTETRNIFSEVDKVMVGDDKTPRPIDFFDGKAVPNDARDAIRGQNTWMLWGEGNEAFWGWVQEHGYGITDFLILLDSRKRDSRFSDAGLINQPGMSARKTPLAGLGLYLDQGKDALDAPKTDIDARTGKPAEQVKPPQDHQGSSFQTFFEIGDAKFYNDAIQQLGNDGVDPQVYGYPTGVVGLRLYPNPDFFGKSTAAENARRYWQERVVKDGGRAYYSKTDDTVHADPMLVRPFRVAMTCAFCHVAPHPLAPPDDPNHPQWGNLSSTIGNQYWRPEKAFSNLKQPHSFLWQFLASQQPGTIDTSLVSTDHINNPNTINAIFEINARLARAAVNPPEQQSAENLRIRGIEDGPLFSLNPRHTPRVLLDGADSIGVEGALARVYLNIGAYSEQWRKVQNTIVGYAAPRPFELATIQEKSVYWRTSQRFRIPELERFFTYVTQSGATVTQPMKLDATPEGHQIVEQSKADAALGSKVFVNNCVVCHSSRQPANQRLNFSRDWRAASASSVLTLPMDFADWNDFKLSRPYLDYVERFKHFMDQEPDRGRDIFTAHNYLSTDVRVPITLAGTNSQRAVATNAMRGQVWDNFSSEDYKSLPAVGAVHFFNPFKSTGGVDEWGNNDSYAPPGGGPGYYRPASLVSLWATAPLLHNNSLGHYNGDPSVKGRLAAFDDAIDKLLNNKTRAGGSGLPGDFRANFSRVSGLAVKPGFDDTGFIYRTTERSFIDFRAPFIRPLLAGVLGPRTISFLTGYLWLILAAIALVFVFVGQARLAGSLLALFAAVLATLLRASAIDTLYPWLWAIPVIALAGACLFFMRPRARRAAQVLFFVSALAFFGVGRFVGAFVDGRVSDISIGPIPQGTPVNLIMNLDPDAPPLDLFRAVSGLARGVLRVRQYEAQLAKEHRTDDSFGALAAFQAEAGPALLKASKCPDFVMDRGHWFGETLSADEKKQLKAFLETL